MDTKLVKPEVPFLRRFGREFDWLVDRFGFDRPLFEAATPWTPYIEAFEKGGEFVVRAELPGLKKEDITIEIAEGELTMSGERKEEVEKKEKEYYRSERNYGRFLRTLALPEGVKIEKATATVNDGVLEVRMPVERITVPRRRVEINEDPKAEKAAAKPAA